MTDYVSTRDLHIYQHKVRLNEADDNAVRDLAARTGVPAAVLLRAIVRDYLTTRATHSVSDALAAARRG